MTEPTATNEGQGAQPEQRMTKSELKKIELSEADKKLKEDIELLFSRLTDANHAIVIEAIGQLRDIVVTSSIMMATVPKSLKFIKPYYTKLKEMQSNAMDEEIKRELADIIASISIIIGDDGDTLKYFILGSKILTENHSLEFVHHLVMNLIEFTQSNLHANEPLSAEAIGVVRMIVKFQMQHNSEIDACDFLMQIDMLELLGEYTELRSLPRVSEYLGRCASLVAEVESVQLLRVVIKIALAHKSFPTALHAAIRLNDLTAIQEVLRACDSRPAMYQMVFMLADLQINVDLPSLFEESLDDNLIKIFSNTYKSKYFLESCKELDILEPKTLSDVFKKTIEFPKLPEVNDTAYGRRYLSISMANNLVNCGFGRDSIFTTPDCDKWISNMSETFVTSAIASTGYLYLWNIDEGLNFVNQFLSSDKPKVKAGGILAAGIIGTTIRDEFDSVASLVSEEMESSNTNCRVAASLSLGITYAGTNLPHILDMLLPHLHHKSISTENIDFICTTALSIGLVSIGTANSDVSSYLIRCMIELSAETLLEKHKRVLALSLALVYTKQPGPAETVLETLAVLPGALQSMASLLVVVMAYAGSGNVERILELMRTCMTADTHQAPHKAQAGESPQGKKTDEKEQKDEDKKTEEDKDSNNDSASEKDETKLIDKILQYPNRRLAVLGLVIVVMGDPLGSQMMLRLISQLTRYGDYKVKSAIPLALALLNVSNPNLSTLHMLTKSTHEIDNFISITSMIALGLVSAGTNNAKFSQMLKSLRSTSAATKDSTIAYVLNVSLGLCYLGKGALTLSPLAHDGKVIRLTALGSLVTFVTLALNHDDFVHGKQSHLWHVLAPAIRSKFVNTYDATTLDKQSIKVRVGAPVDTVSHAGKQRRVTGFQTHSTPVAIACDERAEIVSDEIEPLTPYIEGNVVVSKIAEEMDVAE